MHPIIVDDVYIYSQIFDWQVNPSTLLNYYDSNPNHGICITTGTRDYVVNYSSTGSKHIIRHDGTIEDVVFNAVMIALISMMCPVKINSRFAVTQHSSESNDLQRNMGLTVQNSDNNWSKPAVTVDQLSVPFIAKSIFESTQWHSFERLSEPTDIIRCYEKYGLDETVALISLMKLELWVYYYVRHNKHVLPLPLENYYSDDRFMTYLIGCSIGRTKCVYDFLTGEINSTEMFARMVGY